jgi:hypothetical protein
MAGSDVSHFSFKEGWLVRPTVHPFMEKQWLSAHSIPFAAEKITTFAPSNKLNLWYSI